MSAPSDDWTTAEIVRALSTLTDAVNQLTTEVKGLDSRYVPREVIESQSRTADLRLDEVARDVAELKEGRRWLVRTAASALVGMGVEALVLAYVLVGRAG